MDGDLHSTHFSCWRLAGLGEKEGLNRPHFCCIRPSCAAGSSTTLRTQTHRHEPPSVPERPCCCHRLASCTVASAENQNKGGKRSVPSPQLVPCFGYYYDTVENKQIPSITYSQAVIGLLINFLFQCTENVYTLFK